MNEDIHSSKMVNPLIDRSNTKSLLTCMVHIYIYIYIYIYRKRNSPHARIINCLLYTKIAL
jgi:hypothetical protein